MCSAVAERDVRLRRVTFSCASDVRFARDGSKREVAVDEHGDLFAVAGDAHDREIGGADHKVDVDHRAVDALFAALLEGGILVAPAQILLDRAGERPLEEDGLL